MYRIKITLIFLVIIIYYLLVFCYYNRFNKPNYLYQGILNLDQHAISLSNFEEKKIIFLGNSPVAGNNIPPRTTTADYLDQIIAEYRVYNLGTMSQSIVESIILYQLAKKYKPHIVFLGINARSFANGQGGTPLVALYEDLLKSVLPKVIYQKIRKDNQNKMQLLLPIRKQLPQILPSDSQLKLLTFLKKVKDKLYGPLYFKQIRGKKPDVLNHLLEYNNINHQILMSFIKLLKRDGVLPVVYFVPLHQKETLYQISAYSKYKEGIKEVLRKKGVRFFDYDDLLPSNNKYFVDFIHRTAKGNQELAKIIYKDIEDDLI